MEQKHEKKKKKESGGNEEDKQYLDRLFAIPSYSKTELIAKKDVKEFSLPQIKRKGRFNSSKVHSPRSKRSSTSNHPTNSPSPRRGNETSRSQTLSAPSTTRSNSQEQSVPSNSSPPSHGKHSFLERESPSSSSSSSPPSQGGPQSQAGIVHSSSMSSRTSRTSRTSSSSLPPLPPEMYTSHTLLGPTLLDERVHGVADKAKMLEYERIKRLAEQQEEKEARQELVKANKLNPTQMRRMAIVATKEWKKFDFAAAHAGLEKQEERDMERLERRRKKEEKILERERKRQRKTEIEILKWERALERENQLEKEFLEKRKKAQEIEEEKEYDSEET